MELIEKRRLCPYCNEGISVWIDPSAGTQSYIEDCQVCCRPITIHVSCDFEGTVQSCTLSSESEY